MLQRQLQKESLQFIKHGSRVNILCYVNVRISMNINMIIGKLINIQNGHFTNIFNFCVRPLTAMLR